MGRDRHGEDAGDRQAGDEDRERVAEPGGERIAAAEPGELARRRPDAGKRLLLASVDDELGRAAQQLDELGGELAARAAAWRRPAERLSRRQRRDEHAAERQARAARIAAAAGRKPAVTATQAAPTASATSGGPSPRR